MTSKIDVYKAYYELSWSNPPTSTYEAGERYLSDDYKSFDKDGNVAMTKEMYIGMGQLLYASFPDFKVVVSDMHETDEGVMINFHFEGTFVNNLDLSAMGLGIIPATGKKIVWPEGASVFMVEGGKITGERSIVGGVQAFLAPLGVKLPTT